LRVDGTNYALQEDDSDEFYAYKNLISAFMPFYQFDDNGTVKSTTTYHLVLQTMKNVWEGGNPNNPNNNRSALDFLSSSAIGGYGFSQVVWAQWDKECVDLSLFNRNLTYDQDFHAKHNLIINTLEDNLNDFSYSQDYLFKLISAENAMALPPYRYRDFTIPNGISSNLTAGNSVSLKGEIYFKAGSEVSVRTVNSNCFSGGRFASTNNNNANHSVTISHQPKKQLEIEKSANLISQFIVAPNPFTTTLIIEKQFTDGSCNFILQNSLGQIAENGTFSSGKTILNLTHLPKGIYFLTIFSKEKTFNQKLIKY